MTELIDEYEIKIYDKVAQREFKRFEINEKGQYAAKDGYKDDMVVMLCIGAYLAPPRVEGRTHDHHKGRAWSLMMVYTSRGWRSRRTFQRRRNWSE